MDHRKLCFCSEGRVAASQFITEIVLSVLGKLTHHPDEALCRLGKSPLNADHCTTTYSGLVSHSGLYSAFMFVVIFLLCTYLLFVLHLLQYILSNCIHVCIHQKAINIMLTGLEYPFPNPYVQCHQTRMPTKDCKSSVVQFWEKDLSFRTSRIILKIFSLSSSGPPPPFFFYY